MKGKIGRLDSAKATLTHVVREMQGKVASLTDPPTASKSGSDNLPALQPPRSDPSTEEGARIPVVIGQQAGILPLNSNEPEAPHFKRHGRYDRRRYRGLTPGQTLSTYSVLTDITTLVIGDSVLSSMTPEQMTTGPDEVVQVIGVSGLKASDLLAWLSEQPDCSHVRRVTLHIGVNDCKRGEVTSRTWNQILDVCRQVFPLARIQMSSIIPARGKLPINESISFSNGNLYHVCKREGVTFIDNTSVFLTSKGAPRKALYRLKPGDFVHPSNDGLLALVANIKRSQSARISSYDAIQSAAYRQWADSHTARAVSGSPQWQFTAAPLYNCQSSYGGYNVDFSPPWMKHNYYWPNN